MKLKLNILSSILFSFCFQKTNAQDLHFSQYFNAPLLVNPANTGFMPDGDVRIGINYRNQWANVGTPYKTTSVFADVQAFNNRFENGWVGIGAAILKDVAGTGNLTSTRVFGSVAYHQSIGFGSLLSVGFNFNWNNKSIDFSKLTFDNQWTGKFFDINIPSGEAFATNQINYFGLGAGINYAYFPNANAYLNVGYSLGNINRPSESFFDNQNIDTRISMRHTVFLNGSFKLDDAWILNPNVYYSNMASSTEIVAGLNAQRNLSGDGNTQLLVGAYYRLEDALIPMIGFQQNNFKITFNYDATSSPLKNFNATKGAYEISIIKQGIFDPSKEVKCPKVSF